MKDPEATNPLPFRKDPTRHIWRVFGWLVVVLIAVPVACTIGGCAAVLPPCPVAEARVAVGSDGKTYAAFTPENLAIWHQAVRDEAQGKCRVVNGEGV